MKLQTEKTIYQLLNDYQSPQHPLLVFNCNEST